MNATPWRFAWLRHTWLRRGTVILTAPVIVALHCLYQAWQGILDGCDELRSDWYA